MLDRAAASTTGLLGLGPPVCLGMGRCSRGGRGSLGPLERRAPLTMELLGVLPGANAYSVTAVTRNHRAAIRSRLRRQPPAMCATGRWWMPLEPWKWLTPFDNAPASGLPSTPPSGIPLGYSWRAIAAVFVVVSTGPIFHRRDAVAAPLSTPTYAGAMDESTPATVFRDVAAEVAVPEDGTLSRVLYKDEQVRLVVFAFDAGQELTDHTAAVAAIVELVAGRINLGLGDEQVEMVPGSWVHMPANLRHSVVALEPSVMLLTMLRGS